MKQKTLIGLAAVTVVALVAALAISNARKPSSDTTAQAGTLVPGLREQVNEVSSFTLTGANNQPLVTLERGEGGWTVAQKGGYPADLGKLREYLLKLADATLIERKTANRDRYEVLGVEDVTSPEAKGVSIELAGLEKPVRVIVGLFDGQGGGGTFARRVDEAESWLVKGTLTPEKNPSDWLQKDLPGIASERIASVTITRAGGKPLRVFRDEPGSAPLKVADVPRGREPSSDYVASGLGSVLADLRLDDVVAAADAPVAENPVTARYATFDGIVVEATAWQVGAENRVNLAASLDEPAAAAHIAREQARIAAEHSAAAEAAAAATPPADDADPAAPAAAGESVQTPAAPLAVGDPAADREQRLAALNDEVARLNAAFAGWTFSLPSYKYANIDKSMDDMLKPVEEKASAK